MARGNISPRIQESPNRIIQLRTSTRASSFILHTTHTSYGYRSINIGLRSAICWIISSRTKSSVCLSWMVVESISEERSSFSMGLMLSWITFKLEKTIKQGINAQSQSASCRSSEWKQSSRAYSRVQMQGSQSEKVRLTVRKEGALAYQSNPSLCLSPASALRRRRRTTPSDRHRPNLWNTLYAKPFRSAS